MESDTSSKPSRPGGLSLYANLLEPSSKTESAPGTISRAPVVFKQGNDESRPDQMAGDKQQQISSGSYQPASIGGRRVCDLGWLMIPAFSCIEQRLCDFNRQRDRIHTLRN